MEVKILHTSTRSPKHARRCSFSNHVALNSKCDNFERSSSLRVMRSTSNFFNNCKDLNKSSPKKSINIASIDEDFTPPGEELTARIVQQVEFYFSDVNIMKDTFLLQHIKHNKEGYISLKLLSGFKRIKQLVKNWRELSYALESGSSMLQLNSEKTKLRRITPLPSYDETTPDRTVVAFDLPLEKPVTIKNVINLFEPCGKIVLVRILLPKNPIPADARPYLASSLPELQGTEACALVEFADTSGVQCAIQRKPASPQASPLIWGIMRVMSLTQIQDTSNQQSSVTNTGHRNSFQNNYPLLPPASALASPCKILSTRRHSCPAIQLTPQARRRVSISIPENVIRLPRGPDGTKGFHDQSRSSSI